MSAPWLILITKIVTPTVLSCQWKIMKKMVSNLRMEGSKESVKVWEWKSKGPFCDEKEKVKLLREVKEKNRATNMEPQFAHKRATSVDKKALYETPNTLNWITKKWPVVKERMTLLMNAVESKRILWKKNEKERGFERFKNLFHYRLRLYFSK